ncbi:methylated-DNA--[protein]-cysteine S-methyltransferase [Nocardiopsis sp. RSe5-2]|uniref:Methylated-DNA--protein-cysteine methyltransferase n=1 Tax=Nocardiopsis endophytica TaxID=3018445 RepID=A0ABT4TYS9_9ACTN|nr:methylated-DNA--[protein]-cysteine S-methyltransferase [Nocardiopsis endophytica]MDA2809853.1 methylated-DNA--[protein]-cysteine S-methyltransferase [Nocardiopsis endophytica]
MSTTRTDTGTARAARVHALIDSPVGPLTLVAQDGALVTLYMSDETHRSDLGEEDPGAFADAERQLREYFAGERTAFDLPLSPHGTEFQKSVWRELAAIPYGVTATYAEVAERTGRAPSSARAVGSANGANPIAIVVPCHRVVGANGSLTGYAWGTDRKRFLLDLEQGTQ